MAETVIFSQQGYKIVKGDMDKYYISLPGRPPDLRPTSAFYSADSAREWITKKMKADGVYGKTSVGNAVGVPGGVPHEDEHSRYRKLKERYLRQGLSEKVASEKAAEVIEEGQKSYGSPFSDGVYGKTSVGNSRFSNGRSRALAEIENKLVGRFENGGGVAWKKGYEHGLKGAIQEAETQFPNSSFDQAEYERGYKEGADKRGQTPPHLRRVR